MQEGSGSSCQSTCPSSFYVYQLPQDVGISPFGSSRGLLERSESSVVGNFPSYQANLDPKSVTYLGDQSPFLCQEVTDEIHQVGSERQVFKAIQTMSASIGHTTRF